MRTTFEERRELAKELASILKVTNHPVTKFTSKSRSKLVSDIGTITISENGFELKINDFVKQFDTPFTLKNELIVLS